MTLTAQLNRLESALVEVASKTGPLLAPVPTAYIAYDRTVEHLDWPPGIGFVAAVVIECLGLASTSLALALWDYRKSKRKSDPPAPLGLALVLVAVYFVAIIALTVALDIVSSLARFAPALFPALSLAGVSVLAIRIDHRERLAAIAREKTQRRERRKRPVVDRQAPGVEKSARWADRWATMGAFLQDVSNDPSIVDGMSGVQFARMTGKPGSTARRWLAAARQNGRIRVLAAQEMGEQEK
ncbi:MAG: hypothetical protein GY832_26100 [Chloroflexi bacterium]|nr:hypothetical protein [Chloroflexota bacterium]